MIMDFRNVTRLFADPDWDGPIEQVEDYGNGGTGFGEPGPVTPPGTEPKEILVVSEDGCTVEVIGKIVSIYDSDGKLLRQESIVDYTRTNILDEYASLDNFIRQWTAEEKKETIKDLLWEQGIDLESMKADQDMSDVDDFDFICHVAFNQKPLTRRERAENVKKRDFLSKYKGAAREVLEALLDRYMNTGIYEIGKTELLNWPPFRNLVSRQGLRSISEGKKNIYRQSKNPRRTIQGG